MFNELGQNQLQQAIANLEMTRYTLYRHLSAFYSFESGIEHNEALPICRIYQPAECDFEMIHLSFEEMLPLYVESTHFKKDHLMAKYRNQTKEYYMAAVIQAVRRQGITTRFDEPVFMLIAHRFKDNVLRDLDNRNRKYLIDAVKTAQIMGDDHWKNLSLMETAYDSKDGHDGVELFLSSRNNMHKLIIYSDQKYL